jgi:hypothetical protein
MLQSIDAQCLVAPNPRERKKQQLIFNFVFVQYSLWVPIIFSVFPCRQQLFVFVGTRQCQPKVRCMTKTNHLDFVL